MEKDFVVNLDGSVEFKKTEKAKIIKEYIHIFQNQYQMNMNNLIFQ